MESGIIKYNTAIVSIKNAIMQSRFKAASLVNRELLSLYFGIGEFISQNTRNKNWGKGAIDVISLRLQQELPGLKGFSASNLKNMRLFYEEWKDYFLIRQLPTAELENQEQEVENRQLLTDDLEKAEYEISNRQLTTGELEKVENDNSNRQLPTAELEKSENEIEIRQLMTAELKHGQIGLFLRVGFTQHREIIRKCKSMEERLFYIEQCATGFWSVEKLKYNIASKLFVHRGKLQVALSRLSA